MDYSIIGLKLTDGQIAPLAYTQRDISDKELRRLTRKFRKDSDFAYGICINWRRLYSRKEEFKTTLPRV